jgi:hypothetical protein
MKVQVVVNIYIRYEMVCDYECVLFGYAYLTRMSFSRRSNFHKVTKMHFCVSNCFLEDQNVTCFTVLMENKEKENIKVGQE